MKKLLLLSAVIFGSASFASAQKAKVSSLRAAKQKQEAAKTEKANKRLEAKKADYKQKHQPTDKITKAPGEAIAPSGNRKK